MAFEEGTPCSDRFPDGGEEDGELEGEEEGFEDEGGGGEVISVDVDGSDCGNKADGGKENGVVEGPAACDWMESLGYWKEYSAVFAK